MEPVTATPNPMSSAGPSPSAYSATPSRSGGGNRRRMFMSAAIIAIFAIVGLSGVGLLVRWQAVRKSSAARCDLFTMVLTRDGDVVVTNGQSIAVDQFDAQLYIDNGDGNGFVAQGNVFTVPENDFALAAGATYTASGVYDMTGITTGFSWRIDILDDAGGTVDFCGGDTFNGSFPDATAYFCGDPNSDNDVRIYDNTTNWNLITDYSNIAGGTPIVLAVPYTAPNSNPQYTPQYARFRVYNVDALSQVPAGTPCTGSNPPACVDVDARDASNNAQIRTATGEYYAEYTIPATWGNNISIRALFRMVNQTNTGDYFWF